MNFLKKIFNTLWTVALVLSLPTVCLSSQQDDARLLIVQRKQVFSAAGGVLCSELENSAAMASTGFPIYFLEAIEDSPKPQGGEPRSWWDDEEETAQPNNNNNNPQGNLNKDNQRYFDNRPEGAEGNTINEDESEEAEVVKKEEVSPETDRLATPCWMVACSAVDTEQKAIAAVRRLKNSGFSNSDYIWLPDYLGADAKKLFRVFVGPFDSERAAKTELPAVKEQVEGAYVTPLK